LILLDTDTVVEFLEKNSHKGQTTMFKTSKSGEERCISSVHMHEVPYGMKGYSKHSLLLLQVPVVGYSKEDSELSAVSELSAERNGKSIQMTDEIVASIAVNNGCV